MSELRPLLSLLLLVTLALAGCDLPAPQGAGIDPLPTAGGERAAGIVPAGGSASGSSTSLLPPLPSLGGIAYPSTPQAVLERAQATSAAGQWQEYVTYLTPDCIDRKFNSYLESAITWDEQSLARSPNPRLQELASRLSGSMQALYAALASRGITRDMLAEAKFNADAKARLLQSIPDKVAFVADVMARGGGSTDGSLLGKFRADNWQIQGDLATVDLVSERSGNEMRLPLEIKRIDGRWKLEM